MTVPRSIASAEAPAFATGALRPGTGHRWLRLALLVLAGLPLLAVSARAEVWEFDRRGNVLRAPADATVARHDAPLAPPRETPPTGRTRAIYQPMAEGVAAVHAQDPAVAAAGLDPAGFTRLFVALIDQESGFDPLARSPKGAQGLGQLMPETAAALGVADAMEPIANLQGAARYLTAQLATFGRIDLALAAYNAGPGAVAQYGGIPPYRETRTYVARITAAAELARPEIGRLAMARPLTPTVLDEAAAKPLVTPAALAAPAQGTVLEWKR